MLDGSSLGAAYSWKCEPSDRAHGPVFHVATHFTNVNRGNEIYIVAVQVSAAVQVTCEVKECVCCSFAVIRDFKAVD
jgi:hypothetical protein